jgi:predicted RNA-binding protein (virulence factor B family)
LELQKAGARKVDDFSEVLLQYIKDNDGFTPLNDKTDAEVIYQTFGVSKKTFKKAVGDLYKKRLVVLEQVSKRLELIYPGHYEWIKGISENGQVYSSILTIQTKSL